MLGRIAATLLLACLVPGMALGQGERVMRIIVAFPPGGPVDFVARSIADPLGKELGARVIVENKSGANGAIAGEIVAHAAADGNTLWLTSVGAVAINPVLYDKLPYDVARDFAPVSLVVSNDELLVVNAADPAEHGGRIRRQREEARRRPPRSPPRERAASPISRWSSSPTSARRTSCMCPTRGPHPPSPTSWAGRWQGFSATFRA